VKSVAGPTSSTDNAVHGCREASPSGAPDESACGVKVARRRATMPSPLGLAGESVRSPECGRIYGFVSKTAKGLNHEGHEDHEEERKPLGNL